MSQSLKRVCVCLGVCVCVCACVCECDSLGGSGATNASFDLNKDFLVWEKLEFNGITWHPVTRKCSLPHQRNEKPLQS